MDRQCPECRDERPFEQPPCMDDHGADCPEWICVECGFAIMVGGVVDEPVIMVVSAA